MAYTTKQMARNLKAAREAKGLTQRALADLAGMPQSHISKIENGTVDLRLSSLVEIARALGLEVTLVPRKTLQAIQSIVRSSTRPIDVNAFQKIKGIEKEYQSLLRNLDAAQQINPMAKEIAQMQRQVKDLLQLQIPSLETDVIRDVNKAVRAFNEHRVGIEELRKALADVQSVRNTLVHAIPGVEHVKPAYSLEDESDG